MQEKKIATGWEFFCLALYAFGGLGLELVLASGIEPLLYGGPSNGTRGRTFSICVPVCVLSV